MSSIEPVLLGDFEFLFRSAREYHRKAKEPIPDLLPDSLDKINSCLRTPFQTGFGVLIYKGFIEKAAILFYLIAKGHCLENGNKRMAVITLSYFAYLNGRSNIISNPLFRDIATIVAASRPGDMQLILVFLRTVFKIGLIKNPKGRPERPNKEIKEAVMEYIASIEKE